LARSAASGAWHANRVPGYRRFLAFWCAPNGLTAKMSDALSGIDVETTAIGGCLAAS
jgi:hypothetical protein